jgi:DnaD/phage-associated family protein
MPSRLETHMTFPGFPARPKSTPIPDVFFSDLLPRLAETGDLAVVLCAFHALAAKKGFPRYITQHDLAAEPALCSQAEGSGVPADLRREGTRPQSRVDSGSGAITRGLDRAVELGILLPLTVERGGHAVTLYFLNAPADRRGLEAVRSGAVDLGPVVRERPAQPVRSSIFTLYESLIGTLSPLIADELAEAERLYPAEWIEAAFREAAAQNARSWRYVSRILERWAIEGPDHATTERSAAEDRYFRGKYGKILKQRLQP